MYPIGNAPALYEAAAIYQCLHYSSDVFLFNIEIFLYYYRCTALFALCPPSTIENERTKNMKRRIIEYKPSPGKQNLTRRLYLCTLTLWRSLWLPTCLVGGLAYDVL